MVCPICGTDCKEANICPNCEWDLTEETADTSISEPPIGRYEGIDGYIEVWYYTMTVYKKSLDKAVEREIAYRDISEVAFVQASDEGNGFLAVALKNSDRRPSNTGFDAMHDDMALSFKIQKNSKFAKLYGYLKCIVETNVNRLNEEVSTGKQCPKCNSKYVRNRYMHVPVFVAIRNSYVCYSCGFQWEL